MKFFLKKINKFNGGFTLVETLVSVSIFTVSLLAIMSVLASSIASTNYAKQKMSAAYLAQEGIEHARNIRDNHVLYDASSGWDNFKNDPAVTNYDISSTYPEFVRTVQISPVGAGSDEVKITSTVSWTQGSGNYNVTFSENLFNWIE